MVMGIKYRFLLISLLISVISFAQECTSCAKFYYKYRSQTDSLDSFSKREDLFVLMKKADSTVFTDVLNKKMDSMEVVIIEEINAGKRSSYSFKGVENPRNKYYIFKTLDKLESPMLIHDKIGNKKFSFYDDTKIDWTLSQEKREIAGFICQKATAFAFGREWIAWFTSEIPMSDGPYKFRGLPGLIIEVYDDKKYFMFSLEKYSKEDQNVDLKIPKYRNKKVMTTTKEKFVIAKINYSEGTVSRLKNSMISDQIPESRYREIQENLKKKNNFLEKN